MSDLIEKGKSTLPSLIQTKVENAQRIAIFGHSHIDGDAIGAMFGLGLQLEKLGKAVSYFSPDMPGRVFDFLDVSKLQTHFDYGSYDVLIFTDFTGLKRIKTFTEGYEKYFNEVEKVIIDHHLSEGEMPNAIVYRDETAISTCELVYELTNERRGEKKLIDSQIATFLYTGMLTDSGNLRYDEGKETERLLTTLLAVFRCWAEKKRIIDNVFRRKSYADVQFMQFVLSRMQKEGNLLFSRFSQAEMAKYGVDDEGSDEALHLMQDIEGFDLIVVGKEDGNEIRMSLRGRGNYDCNLLAKHFGGGGHFNAAGCRIPRSWAIDTVMKRFIEKLKRLISLSVP